MQKHYVATLAAILIGAAPASAVMIDFNGETANGDASLTISGVTFTAPGGGLYATAFGNTPNGTRGLVGWDGGSAFLPIRATIAGGATSVSIDLGDNNADPDDLFLRAYDASNTLIASDLDFIDAPFVGMVTLSVSAANIAYVEYGGVGVQGSSVYTDNFTFDGAVVPEPASWALMIAGFGLAGMGLRSQRRTAAIA